jgi:hypothetical protein
MRISLCFHMKFSMKIVVPLPRQVLVLDWTTFFTFLERTHLGPIDLQTLHAANDVVSVSW